MSAAHTDSGHLVEVTMPRLSDSMEEATVLRWLKRPGDPVARGEPLVEIETDKATVVYEAELDGILAEIAVDENGTAALGQVIARIQTDGDAPAPALAAPAPVAAPEAPPPSAEASEPAPAVAPGPARGGRQRATPVARRVAAELAVPLDGVSGSGPGGRIVRADVRRAAGDGRRVETARVGATGRGETTEVVLTPTQRTIAERMSISRATIPEFTLESEVDMEAALALREDLRELGHEQPPSLNDLVVRAVALSLREFPAVNGAYVDGKVLRFERINVGIAVATEDALVVPTIFDADRKSLFEIAASSRRLVELVRQKTIPVDELRDGTFTISNLGMFGVRRFNAVINPPQAAILAVGEVSPRAVVGADGELVARRRMDVSLSCDHRVVYGAEAARFLQRLKLRLERPVALAVEQGETR